MEVDNKIDKNESISLLKKIKKFSIYLRDTYLFCGKYSMLTEAYSETSLLFVSHK